MVSSILNNAKSISYSPLSSGVNYCAPLYTEKFGCVTKHQTFDTDNGKAIKIIYAFDGMINLTLSGNYVAYLGGSSCWLLPDDTECSNFEST